MTAVTPVAPNSTATVEGAIESVNPVRQSGPTSEQRLLDYIARFQAEGLARAQHLANPAAMSGEALKALNGYFERATALQDAAARKVQVMSDQGDGAASGTGKELATLPGGPARERLEPAIHRASAPGQKIEAITEAKMSRAVDALMEVLRYSMDTAMVTTATNNISKSATTLTRGQ
jgi:hypothetical protein